MGQPLLIDLVADVVCPWCYLGWRRVKSAVALRPDVEPLIVWRPYQLDPTLPEQGVDRKAYMAGKFKDALKLKTVHTALVEAGAEEGIVFDFDAIALSPNTSAAHRLIRWAHGAGKQDAVVEALFAAYFTKGRDIGDPVVLADIGEAAGMDPVVILRCCRKARTRKSSPASTPWPSRAASPACRSRSSAASWRWSAPKARRISPRPSTGRWRPKSPASPSSPRSRGP
jgi:predicted DsbA family dithiol-disulfide isomerase